MDVRAYRGAGVNSDHNLCIGKIKLKLKSQHKKSVHRKINSHSLQEENINYNFSLKLTNHFKTVNEVEETDTDELWNSYSTAIITAARARAGLKKPNRKAQIS